MARNQVVISGELIALETVRFTPAGIASIALTLRHVSQQIEAGEFRQLQCEIEAVAFAEAAQKVAGFSVGQTVRVKGFLAQRSLRNRHLVLHVNDIVLE
ncbi:MAG: primosomal replication protein N [Gallionella sp.]|nr:primosomal replication protein N [Gallionella sp.]